MSTFHSKPTHRTGFKGAFTICRVASCVHTDLPSLSLGSSRRGTLFLEMAAGCFFCLGRSVLIEPAEGFVKLLSLSFAVGVYAGSFVPILT